MDLTHRNRWMFWKSFSIRTTLYVLFLLGLNLLFGQEVRVVDAFTQAPLSEVLVINQTKDRYVSTDNNGVFALDHFQASDILTFQLMGYENRTLPWDKLETTIHLFFDEKQLEEIVLSVARTAEQSKKIAEQVQVIAPQKVLRPTPLTSADLLRDAPSIRLQKSQGGGGSPVLRGFEANRVLLVVDGVRMNNAIYRSGHLQNALTIDPNSIERVEVIYGSSSVGYGSDALGGVVHYYTKTPKINSEKKRKSRFSSTLNSAQNAQTYHLENEQSFQKWAVFTSLTYAAFGDIRMGNNRAHGYENWGLVPFYSANTPTTYFENPTANPQPNLQKNTGYQQIDLLHKTVFNLGQETQLLLNFQWSDSSNIPRFDKLNESRNGRLRFAEWYYGPQRRILFSPQLKIFPKKAWIYKGTITTAYQNIGESRHQRRFGSLEKLNQIEQVDVWSVNGDFEIAKKGKSSIAYGFEIIHNAIASEGTIDRLALRDTQDVGIVETLPGISRYPNNGSQYGSQALYVNMRYDLSPKTTWSAGGRITNTLLKAKWKDDEMLPTGLTEVNVKNTAITGSLSLSHRPSPRWRINLLLASGFRAPNIDDLGKIRENRGTLLVPNPALKSEYVYSLEGGVAFTPPSKKLNLQLRFYNSSLQDYIARMPYSITADLTTDAPETVTYNNEIVTTLANGNAGNSRIYGLSIEGKWRLAEPLTVGAHLTHTQNKINETIGPLPSILPYFGGSELVFSKKKWTLELRHQFASNKPPEEYSRGGEDGVEETPIIGDENGEIRYAGSPKWTTISFYSTYQKSDTLSLYLAVENLTDLHYRTFASGISAPGRSLIGGIQVAF